MTLELNKNFENAISQEVAGEVAKEQRAQTSEALENSKREVNTLGDQMKEEWALIAEKSAKVWKTKANIGARVAKLFKNVSISLAGWKGKATSKKNKVEKKNKNKKKNKNQKN